MIFENYYLYQLGMWLVAHLPRGFVDWTAVSVVDLNYLLNRRGRNGIWANLRRVLPPETSHAERRRIARGTFRNFALSIADFFRILQLDDATADQFVAEVQGWEHIRAAMDAGMGGIFMSAHMGSWELAGAYLGLRGVPLTGVVLPHRDPRIDDIYMNIRRQTGVEVVTVGGAVRHLFEALKRGRFIGIAADRDTSGQGIPLPFFGEITHMPTGHAKLALRTGAWILPTCIYRRPDGRIAIEVRPPIVPDPLRDTEQSLALRCIGILEEFIRARPEQWSSFVDLWDDPDATPANVA
jgi:KDO2-lipid IV(A) lauroyltransferase